MIDENLQFIFSKSNFLMLSTLRLEFSFMDFIRYSTGSLISLSTPRGSVDLLVTNAHCVQRDGKPDQAKDSVDILTSFSYHTKEGASKEYKEMLHWFLHPSLDLAVTRFEPILKETTQYDPIFVFLSDTLFAKPEQLRRCDPINTVYMVGYPKSIYDSKNNFPLFRSGITATHPSVDYEGKQCGVLDISALPGSSGSPVFIEIDPGIRDSGYIPLGTRRLKLLGIEYGSFLKFDDVYKEKEASSSDDEKYIKIENEVVSLSTHLGKYVKAKALFDFLPSLSNH